MYVLLLQVDVAIRVGLFPSFTPRTGSRSTLRLRLFLGHPLVCTANFSNRRIGTVLFFFADFRVRDISAGVSVCDRKFTPKLSDFGTEPNNHNTIS